MLWFSDPLKIVFASNVCFIKNGHTLIGGFTKQTLAFAGDLGLDAYLLVFFFNILRTSFSSAGNPQ